MPAERTTAGAQTPWAQGRGTPSSGPSSSETSASSPDSPDSALAGLDALQQEGVAVVLDRQLALVEGVAGPSDEDVDVLDGHGVLLIARDERCGVRPLGSAGSVTDVVRMRCA